MPLPPALLAKLSKRGIVPQPKSTTKVFKKEDFKGYVYCPNKVNIYHICTSWCEANWKGNSIPDPVYARNIQKLLFKYPLPNNWTEVFDKAVGRYYYWNIENDLVSWLPPKHPKANITKCAAKLRELRKTSKKVDSKEKNVDDSKNDLDEKEFKKPQSRSSNKRENDREKDDKYRKEDKYGNKRPRKENNVLDPMDPASYSDIAPGTWSDGLENNKTHADNTASGVLYQQRPYPSPGEVLSSNKEKHAKKH
ncbi:hypothetical protein WA026_006851 [Henosepilachna vigintioctopunctata]|uniref:WW domain-containing protein n=1 Tax=Henosepilachna vigintioctopunctata TaxID=420089 RepID=A0AAW1UAW1_9CUCU